MEDWFDPREIAARVDALKRERPDGNRESDRELLERCKVDATLLSKWRAGAGVSLQSLARIAITEGVSLDQLALGPKHDPDPAAYDLLDRIASEIRDVLNRAYELTPERRQLELIQRQPKAEHANEERA